ncbi:hypothetical protein GWG83_001578 [Enterococcus faecalis]|nr:hypothetical protein [Enterococcus faecalis]ELS0477178.1 hypothetical protein [Enterococcus faecalis]
MKLLKQTDIKDFLKSYNLLDSNTYFVWGTVGNSYFIISFCDKGICLLPVAFSGNLSGEIHLLEKKDIEILDMKKKIFSYKLIIKPKDIDLEQINFTIRPFMIGYKGQKENIENILKIYFN